jgi:hypothetical protein
MAQDLQTTNPAGEIRWLFSLPGTIQNKGRGL